MNARHSAENLVASVRGKGVQLEVVNDARCVELMRKFIAARPDLWNEDIGEP